MRPVFKILLVFIGICTIHTLLMYHPVIFAYFDDGKFIEDEVFTPVNGTFDFRKFSLNDSKGQSYTTIIPNSGFAQLVEKNRGYTINVFEWDKMTNARKDRTNSSFQLELEKPHHKFGNVTVYDGVFLEDKFYSAYVTDDEMNTQVYIATPTIEETVELINNLEFHGG